MCERFRDLLKVNSESLAQLISAEVGKPWWEARTEVASMANKIDISVQAYRARTGESASAVADGEAVLRDVLVKCTQHNFTVSSLEVKREIAAGQAGDDAIVMVALEIQGTGAVSKLVSKLADLEGVISVNAGDVNVLTD